MASRVQGGNQAADEGGNEGARQRIGHDSPVELDFLHARQVAGESAKRLRGAPCDHEPKSRACRGEKESLCEQLGDDATARSAERAANSDFLLTPRGTRQQQGRNVRAND